MHNTGMLGCKCCNSLLRGLLVAQCLLLHGSISMLLRACHSGPRRKFAAHQRQALCVMLNHSWQAQSDATWVCSPQRPEHLREDFCGTALICAVWCRGDCRRTATGLDIDQGALAWGCRENATGLLGDGGADLPRLCLLQCDVLDPVAAAECVSGPPGAGEAREPPGSGRAAAEHGDGPAGSATPWQAGSSSAECLSGQPVTQGAGEQASRGTERVGGPPERAISCEQASPGSAECASKLNGTCEVYEQASCGGAEAARMNIPSVLPCERNTHDMGGESRAKAAPRAARPPCESACSGSNERASPSGNLASTSCSEDAAAGAPLQRGVAHAEGSGPGPGPGYGTGRELELQGAGDLCCKPADIVCAMNFSVCLLHRRTDVQVKAAAQTCSSLKLDCFNGVHLYDSGTHDKLKACLASQV